MMRAWATNPTIKFGSSRITTPLQNPPIFFRRNNSVNVSRSTPIDREYVASVMAKRKPHFSNPQEMYLSDEVYKADIRNIWRHFWLFAGYTFQVSKPGDFFTYDIGNESLIIIRGKDEKIRALYNVCRHRGSRICAASKGHKTRLVCPYHGWTYSSEGDLVKANAMSDNFVPSEWGLHQAELREVGGLIFISLSDNPPPFQEGYDVIYPEIKPHRFDLAKIAHEETYDIKANWKLVYENNRECYHCNIAHPEYIRSNYDTSFIYSGKEGKEARIIDPQNPRKSEIEQRIAEENERWKTLGLHASPDSSFPGAGWYRASRTPLRKGWSTESLDGQLVCKKLMGDFSQQDMGSCRVHILPNFWIHASSDHAVGTRLTPVSPNLTKAHVTWIVHKDAEEGKDYTLDKMLPFWKLTSEQDWKLCENNQLGVESDKYVPGPFSSSKEAGLEKFINWYVKNIQKWDH
jgi:Rieske 2Fe-2S family protein